MKSKKPLLKKKHVQTRKEFFSKYSAGSNKKWGTVLSTDESKFLIFGLDSEQHVRRPLNKEFDPRYTKNTVRLGGRSNMVRECFSSSGAGPNHLMPKIKRKKIERLF